MRLRDLPSLPHLPDKITPWGLRERIKRGTNKLLKGNDSQLKASALLEEIENPILIQKIKQEKAEREAVYQAKKNDVGNKYAYLLEGKNYPPETERVANLLDKNGFSYTVDPDTHEIANLDWESKERDFTAFSVLIERLRATLHLSDQHFLKHISRIGQELRNGSPLYSSLDNDDIPRSKAHVLNPYHHTLAVGKNTITQSLNPHLVFWARLNFFMHDIGKIMIAIGDHTHAHAEISYLIWRQYFSEHPLKEFAVDDQAIQSKSIELFMEPVRYHHVPETIQYGAINAEEAFTLMQYQPYTNHELLKLENISRDNHDLIIFEPDEALFMMGTLVVADASSVYDYINHAVANAQVFFVELFSQLTDIDWNKYSRDNIRQVLLRMQFLTLAIASPDPKMTLASTDTQVVDPESLEDDEPSPFDEAALRRAMESNKQLVFFGREHQIF